jgi:hypothetical protein
MLIAAAIAVAAILIAIMGLRADRRLGEEEKREREIKSYDDDDV